MRHGAVLLTERTAVRRMHLAESCAQDVPWLRDGVDRLPLASAGPCQRI